MIFNSNIFRNIFSCRSCLEGIHFSLMSYISLIAVSSTFCESRDNKDDQQVKIHFWCFILF